MHHVQECGVVKIYMGVLSPQIDPPDCLPILTKFFQKLSLIQGMAQKVLRVYVDQCSGSLPHSIEIPPYRPTPLNFGGSKFLSCFYFLLNNIQTSFS